MRLYVTHVNEMAETVDFAFGNTEFTVLVRDGKKGLKAYIPSYDAAYDLPNWVLAQSKRQAMGIIRDHRERALRKRAQILREHEGEPEQLSFTINMGRNR